jgi:hypothetical protein
MSRKANPNSESELKPGFYQREFLPRELRDLELALDGGLENEISMLRVATRRFFEIASQTQELDEAAMALRTLALAAGRLATLARTQDQIGRKAEQSLDAIAQALQEVADEWELKP